MKWADEIRMVSEQINDTARFNKCLHFLGKGEQSGMVFKISDKRALRIHSEQNVLPELIPVESERVDAAIQGSCFINTTVLSGRIEMGTATALPFGDKPDPRSTEIWKPPSRDIRAPHTGNLGLGKKGGQRALQLSEPAANVAGQTSLLREDLAQTLIEIGLRQEGILSIR